LRLLNYVKIIPSSIIINFKEEADEIIGKIDKNDAPFVATALAFFWSYLE
jgi:predicted nucleic acid-binding protein